MLATIHAWPPGFVTRQVPLAAKLPSLGCAFGNDAGGMRVQCAPASYVVSIAMSEPTASARWALTAVSISSK